MLLVVTCAPRGSHLSPSQAMEPWRHGWIM
uniref:Uncharacterized protein n=1 Tax=Arundo donax TaxID=35708 RepID=A0A0A9BRT2_ARUDO